MTASLYWLGVAMLCVAVSGAVLVPLVVWWERRADARDKAEWDRIQRRARL